MGHKELKSMKGFGSQQIRASCSECKSSRIGFCSLFKALKLHSCLDLCEPSWCTQGLHTNSGAELATLQHHHQEPPPLHESKVPKVSFFFFYLFLIAMASY